MLSILFTYRQAIISGLSTTLLLSVIAWGAGLLLGTLLGYLAQHRIFLARLIEGANFFFFSVPIIVLLFWMHYPLQAVLGVVLPPFLTAASLLSAVAVFSVADIVQRSLRSIETDYLSAAIVCGMNQSAIFRYIQIPIFLRNAIPSLLRAQVSILHMTLFTSLISVDEIFRTAQRINAEVYKPVEIYTALAVLWISITIPLSLLASTLERKFHGGSHPLRVKQ